MPAGGIYLSNDSAQKLSGDLFEQDARGIVADHFEQQATAALPDYVAQAQRDEQQRQQALDVVQQQQRDQAAQQFESSVPDLVSQHLATLAPPESLQNGPSVVTATEPPAAPDLPNAPAVVAADAAVGTSAPSPPVVPSVPASPEPASSSPPSPVTVPPVATQPTAQTVTTAGLSGGGDLAGRVGQRGQEIMAAAGDAASWLGEQGQKALQAVLLTEGGLAGARGDKGQSAGPLQFYEGGQLANFARQHGLNFDQAKTYVEQNPEAAVQWAIGTPDAPGYLGATILKGIQQGLSGASLATYAQQHGQVSVSPERAGQNWDALFGDGQNAAIGSIGPGGQQTVAKDPSSILDAVKPFLGDKYAWGGKSPTTGFDCSGLAGYLTTGQAESTGTLYGKSAAVSQDTAQPGDLVFWNMGSSDPHMQHVAVYLGNGQIVQSGGNQASVNIGSVGQSIGSPPEFRRVGQSGGMPAQATLAKEQGVPPDQSAAAAPPEPSLWDKVGNTVQSGLQGLQGIFGGGAAANQLPGQGGAPIYNQTTATGPTAAPTDVAQNALPTLQRGLGEFATGTGTIGQASPSTLLSKGMQAVGDTGVAQTVAHTLAPYITTGEVPPDYSHMTGEQLDQQALMVGGMAGPLQMGKIAGAAGHLAQPVESAVADAAGAVKPAVAAQVADLQGWLARAAQHPEVSPQVIASKQAQLADLLKPPELPTGGYPSYPAPPAEAAAKPQAGTDMLTGLIQMAKSKGMDTSAFEARVAEMTPKEAPPARPVELPPEVPPPPPPGTFSDEIGAVPPSVPTGGAQPWDYLRALRVGSLAGGVQTMSHILLNAPIQTAFKLMSDLPLSVVHPDTIPLEFMGAWQGLRGWASKAAAAPLGQPAKIAQTIGGTTGQVVETGLLGLVKTHPVIQDMARQIGSGMELWRLAGTEATNAGLQRFSAPWWTEVQNMVANPTAEMAAAAQRTGSTFSLGGPMGQTGEAFAKLKGDSKAVDFIMPFFQIGYHVASQGIELSPLGLLGTGIDAARGALGSGPYAAGALGEGVTPLAQRFRNNLVGTGLAVEAFHQAAQGNITGNGPDDPGLKEDLTATGWQQDSIRIGGRYFPLHVLGPMGWPLAEAANLYEATHTNQDDGGYAKPKADMQAQFGNYVSRMAQYGTNETFLSSIGKVLQAAANTAQGSRMADSEIASILGSLIPQGALFANAAASMDPYNRKPAAGDIGQSIQNRIPGMRQDLPLRLTPTGQPEPNAQQGLGILLPRSSLVNPDPVISAMGQAGIGAPTVPKTVSVTSKYQMDLTPQEQEQMQELHGKALNDQLKDAVADPDWKSLPIEKQRAYIQKANANATDIARKQLLDQIPDADLERRLVLKTDVAAGNRVTVLGGVP